MSLALGSFDGLHLGHRAVLDAAKAAAEVGNSTPAVLLFDENPKRALGFAGDALMTDEERDHELVSLGFKLIRVRFAVIRDMEPDDFFSALYKEFNLSSVCCGFNFRFGRDGAGNVETLSLLCEDSGVELRVAEPVSLDGEIVSSTAIRRLISSGDVNRANKMLGRPFSFTGKVIDGDKRGRTLGFPTANQSIPKGLITPKRGVYASVAFIDGIAYPAATNIGTRPTFNLTELLSETYIIGFSRDIYGEALTVSLLEYIRGETGYSSAEALADRLKEDTKEAEKIYTKVKQNECT